MEYFLAWLPLLALEAAYMYYYIFRAEVCVQLCDAVLYVCVILVPDLEKTFTASLQADYSDIIE